MTEMNVTDAQAASDEGQAQPRRRWGVLVAWVLVFSLLGVVGLGLLRSRQGSIGVGARVPDFTVTTFDGQQVTIADLRGKIVVINFWASWCTTCELEAADLEEASRLYKDQGVVFLGIDYVDTERDALQYLQKYNITYPNGPDLGTRISQAFRMTGVPETYVVDRDGILTYTRKGPFASLQEIVAVVEAALAQ